MKKLKFNIALVALAIFCSGLNVFAEKQEFTKNYKKEYVANEATELHITNKFGDVNINNWAENKIEIEVIITAKASSQEKADKILNNLSVEFNQTGDIISAETLIGEKLSGNVKWETGDDSQEFSIDYNVRIPIYLKLTISNKYGNLFIDEIHGKSSLNVKYGKIKADKLLFDETEDLSELQLSYGKANITEISRMKMIVGYSDVNIGKCGALVIQSKYSEVNIESNKALVTESKYDEYEIGTTNSVVVIGKYSDYKFNIIKNKLDFDLKYSNCIVKSVPADFKTIKVLNKYGNIEIAIDESASYTINAIGQYCNISVPGDPKLNNISTGTDTQLTGSVGSNPSSEVIINSKYGNISLME